MATPLYFPNPIAAMGQPQIAEPPQSNTGVTAMAAALEGFTSVANNFRQKEMNVQKANQMADALEREGLGQEANLYREAAKSYQIDFFATPQENERFNQSLLNDTLKLLTDKQEREMKAQQFQLERQYKQALIQNQLADAGLSKERLALSRQEAGIRQEEINERRAERTEDRRIREEQLQSSAIKSNIDTAQEELTRTRTELDKLKEDYRKGLIPKDRAEQIGNDLRRKEITLQQNLSDNRKKLSLLGQVPFVDAGISMDIFTTPKTYSEVEKEYRALADQEFKKNPLLRKVTYIVEGKPIPFENRNFRGQGTVRISKRMLSDGTEVEEEVYSEPVPIGQGSSKYGNPSDLPAGKSSSSGVGNQGMSSRLNTSALQGR